MSRFDCVESAPAIEIFALSKAYKEDTNPQKVDLGIGAYRTNEAKPWVLPVVRKAEHEIANDDSLNHEYLSQLGDDLFAQLATKMLLGDNNKAIEDKRAFGVQCLSGTGALRVGADFLRRNAGFKTVYVSDPSWPNHKLLFNHAGFESVRTYRYWDAANRQLDFDGLIEDLRNAPEDSVIVLHACAHNPTGIDPTVDQWKAIADVIEEKKLFPFFDCAYQGFASGDLDKDANSVRYFVDRGFEILCAQSFAKNFGLYNERIGNLTVVLKNTTPIVNSKAQITLLIRGNYSNPPVHGSRIVAKVLNDPQLYQEWRECIKSMAGRIQDMRNQLRQNIEKLGTSGKWSHITDQIGMFSYTGLNKQQIQHLVDNYHIYLPKDGRISLSGINTQNVEYVAKAINDAVNQFP
ncbi:aspartate aminotransferase, cytoplasmic-like [Oppia nitens]|uniref:aspartate aminotransferase, cytoplasmic-like n=1 Tax=Oppia nitens TaxID=1686743 RepID=UPI0023DBAA4E|nr:aspartate aminotransferase, cytoplasmic-like [Oppia nitens]